MLLNNDWIFSDLRCFISFINAIKNMKTLDFANKNGFWGDSLHSKNLRVYFLLF